MRDDISGAARSQDNRQLKVFISYSRRDLHFAERLVAALEQRNITCSIDTRDLPTLEDWRRELLGFIRGADAVVFVVSPSSIESPVCTWEIEQVREQSKRLAPVVVERVADDRMPEALARINYLFFDGAEEFETCADRLASALQTDITWVKEHTRIAELARRWDERGRTTTFQLRGKELEEAESWIGNRPPGAPSPTDLHRQFLSGSRTGSFRRQRAIVAGSLISACVALTLAGAAFWQRQVAVGNQRLADEQRVVAEQQREAARRNEQEANTQRAAAVVNEMRAGDERDRALLTQSRFLTDLASKELGTGNTTRAALLALEALPDGPGKVRPWYAPAQQTLLDALQKHHERALILQHDAPVSVVRFFDSGRRYWSLSRTKLAVWDARTNEPLFALASEAGGTVGSDGDAVGFAISHAGNMGVLAQRDGKLKFIDMTSGRVTSEARVGRLMMNYHMGQIGPDQTRTHMVERLGGSLINSFDRIVSFSPDDQRLIVFAEGNFDKDEYHSDVHVYSLPDLKPIYRTHDLFGVSYPTALTFSPDGRFMFTGGDRKALVIDLATGKETGSTSFDLLPPTNDDRFYRLRTSFPKSMGDIEKSMEITANSVRPPDSVVFARYLDPKRILLVQRGGSVAVWDIERNTTTAALKIGATWIMAAAYSDATGVLAVGSKDHRIRLIDTSRMEIVGELGGHDSEVDSLSFNPDGSMLASTSKDQTARVWRTGSRELLYAMHGSNGRDRVMSVALSADDTPVTGHASGALRRWSGATIWPPRVIEGRFGRWSRLAFAGDGHEIFASAGIDLVVYDSVSGTEVRRMTGHTGLILDAKIDSAARLAATTALDGTVRVWDFRTGRQLFQFGEVLPKTTDDGSRDYTYLHMATRWQFARAIAFSPDGNMIFIGRNTGVGEVRDCASGELLSSFGPDGETATAQSFNPRKGITAVVFTPDGRHVVAGRLNGSVIVKTLADGSRRTIVLGDRAFPEGEVTGMAFDRAGQQLWISAASKPFSFAMVPMAVAFGSRYASGGVQAGFSLTGNLLRIDFGALLRGEMTTLVADSPQLLARWESDGEANSPIDLKLDEEGTLILSGDEMVAGVHNAGMQRGQAGQVQSFGDQLAKFKHHFGTISGIMALDDGAVMSWGHDSTIRIWDGSSASHRAVMVGANGGLIRIAATRDGARIAAAAGNRAVIWDARESKPIAEFDAAGEIVDVAYSPDGKTLAGVTASGQILMWNQLESTQAVVDTAKQLLNRCLTGAERELSALGEDAPDWCVERKLFPYRRARIGVALQDVKPEARDALRYDGEGALITGVGGLPALEAGLRQGDIIIGVGLQRVTGAGDATTAISQSPIGKALELQIWRDGKSQAVIVRPGSEE